MNEEKLNDIDTVVLTELQEADKAILFEWINNKELVEYNSHFLPVTWENHCAWFDRIKKDDETKIFAIRVKNNNSIIGSCQLTHINTRVGSSELQIRLGYFPVMGKGLGSKAVNLLLIHGFETLGLQRIYLHVFSDNERAIKSYMKNNFVKEGLLRRSAFVNGVFKDVYLMSILKEELQK